MPQFSYINGVDTTAGVQMIVEDGQSCNAQYLYPRQANITILCGATNQLVSYYEGSTCHYYLTVLTPIVCPAPPATVVGTSYCGIGNYNFSLLAFSDDIVGEFVGQSIWVRLCGAVRQLACVAAFGYTTEVCQYQNGGGTYSLATATSAAGQIFFGYANGVDGSQGITFSINNGQVCSGIGPRKSVGYLICGPTNSLLSFFESPACTYNMNITTPLACNGGVGANSYALVSTSVSATAMFGFCIQTSANYIPGYTIWSSVTTGVFTATTSAAPVWRIQSISGYRLVAKSDFSGSVGSNATITGLAAGGSNIAYYTPSLGSTVYFDGNGLSFGLNQVQTDVSGCSGSTITVNYYSLSCNLAGTTSTGYTVTIVPLAAGAAPGIPCGIPSTPLPTLQAQPTCGIGGTDFSTMKNAGDLSITANGTPCSRGCAAR